MAALALSSALPISGGQPLTTSETRRKLLHAYYVGNEYLLDPRNSRLMPIWDIVMLCCLLFTALVTPYEVTFLDEGACVTALFVVNRLLDCLFIIDMGIIFNLITFDEVRGRWVATRAQITRNYLTGWFVIDLITVLPFWLAPFFNAWASGEVVDCSFSTNAYELVNDGGKRAAKVTSTFRIIKLLRLIKIVRVVRASRVLKRMLQDVLMTRLEMTFATLKIWKLLLSACFIAHWQACTFTLIPAMLPSTEETWITEFIQKRAEQDRT